MAGAFRGWGIIGYGAARGLRNLCGAIALTTGYAVADEAVIVAFGDSLTAGYGLQQGDGFVPQLDAWLAAKGTAVDLRNAGVSGDTTAGGASRIAWTLTPEVDGMIVALGGNDYLRGIDPAVSRANLRKILRATQAQGVDVMLVGLEAGGNYGPAYKAAFEAMYSELAAEFDADLVPNFFAGLLDEAGTQERVREFMQADGIHPNRKGVSAIVAAIGPEVSQFVDDVTNK